MESFPEDDRVHDILVAKDLATGHYEEAFVRARRRWQVAQEEKTFYQEHGYHKREGKDRKQIFGPSDGDFIHLRDEFGNEWRGVAERQYDDTIRYRFRVTRRTTAR